MISIHSSTGSGLDQCDLDVNPALWCTSLGYCHARLRVPSIHGTSWGSDLALHDGRTDSILLIVFINMDTEIHTSHRPRRMRIFMHHGATVDSVPICCPSQARVRGSSSRLDSPTMRVHQPR